MGMFDKPKYLTGKEGEFSTGDKFWLHNAKIDGTTSIGGESRPQAKLLVSYERDGEKLTVWTSGRGITGAVSRMDDSDRRNMPMEVRLDEIPATQAGRSPTNVLVPADAPPAAETQDDIPF